MTLISHVITTFNRKELLIRHLYAMKLQTYKDFEVIVVSDGSTDGTVDEIKCHAFPFPLTVREIPHEGNRVTLTRNIGIQEAHGYIVTILDDDRMPVPGYLLTFANTVRDGHAVLGYTCHMEPHKSPHHLWRNTNGNIGITKHDIMRIGMYDEAITSYGLEDLDLGIRMFKGGIDVTYERDAYVVEDNLPYTPSPIPPEDKQAAMRKNFMYLSEKYPDLDELLDGWDFYNWLKQSI